MQHLFRKQLNTAFISALASMQSFEAKAGVRIRQKRLHSAHMQEQSSRPEVLPYECIIPSAGLSRRMGTWKPLLEYRNRPLILASVDNALSACERVILVSGHRAEELEKLCEREYNASQRLECIRNPQYERGMFSSIQAAAAHIRSSWFFVSLGDMPEIPKKLYFKLAEMAAQSDEYDIIRPVFQERPAHPVLLRHSVIKSIRSLPADANMQKVFRYHSSHSGQKVMEVPVDEPGSLFDIDTPADLGLSDPHTDPQEE
ncbi:MAG: nucleotidyltransferase family protein [Spirochaetia bacterium]